MTVWAIDFNREGNCQEHMEFGWSSPERDITWSVGMRSVLRAAAPSEPGDYALGFRAYPMSSTPQQRLQVSVNAITLAGLVITQEIEAELLVPWQAIAGRAELRIVLDHPDAARPSRLGESDEEREISLAFRSMRLRRLPVPGSDGGSGPSGPGIRRASDRDVMAQLESLGVNCEFGFAQRAVGVEPLGLLRWSLTPIASLRTALESRFDGIGEPGNIELGYRGDEYWLRDRRHGIQFHTFQKRGGMSPDSVVAQEARRLSFLVRKLLEDLSDAEKVFVFHDAGQSGRQEIDRLVSGLQAFGPNVLLWVVPAERPAQVGRAEIIGTGLIRGYLDRFANIHRPIDGVPDVWLRLARQACDLRDRMRNAV